LNDQARRGGITATQEAAFKEPFLHKYMVCIRT